MENGNGNANGGDTSPLVGSDDAELRALLGMFSAPAFARRGVDVEYGINRLHVRCRREREAMLEMVRLRLRQWASAVEGPDAWAEAFDRPIAELWILSGAPSPAWAAAPASPRRRRAIARDLVASIERFNRRWGRFLDDLKLDPINAAIDQYNEKYLFEKEICLGSSRLAARHFRPKPRLSHESFREEYPLLPVPGLAR